jgi:hypothetical protein
MRVLTPWEHHLEFRISRFSQREWYVVLSDYRFWTTQYFSNTSLYQHTLKIIPSRWHNTNYPPQKERWILWFIVRWRSVVQDSENIEKCSCDHFLYAATSHSEPGPPHYRSFKITLSTDLHLTIHNTHNRHSCHRRDSNPQSQQASGRIPMPWTARPLGSAFLWKYDFVSTRVLLYRAAGSQSVFVGNMQYHDGVPFHYTQDFGVSD